MKIGILGSGQVAQTLAGGFLKHHHEVMLGTRDQQKLQDWARHNPGCYVGSFRDAAKYAELAVLAVKGQFASAALHAAGSTSLTGKIVLDVTNPIADRPPVNGVLSFTTTLDRSLMEQLQEEFAELRFVKAFNSVGVAVMVNPRFDCGAPTMFICGNDESAKCVVTELLRQFGWEAEDLGSVEAARAIEPLCMLWCIPGFLRNSWAHAFRILR